MIEILVVFNYYKIKLALVTFAQKLLSEYICCNYSLANTSKVKFLRSFVYEYIISLKMTNFFLMMSYHS